MGRWILPKRRDIIRSHVENLVKDEFDTAPDGESDARVGVWARLGYDIAGRQTKRIEKDGKGTNVHSAL